MGGVRWIDNYDWLQTETEEVLAWQQAQHEAAGAYLREGPEFQYALERIDTSASKTGRFLSTVRNLGGRWFSLLRSNDGDRLFLSRVKNKLDEAIIEPELLKGLDDSDGSVRLVAFEPSPDGRVLGFALDSGATRTGTWRFLDVETRRLLEISYSCDLFFERPEWFKDSKGFYRPGRDASGLHRFEPMALDDQDPGLAGNACSVTLTSDELDINFNKMGQLSPEGGYLLISSFTPSPQRPLWLVDTRTGKKQAFLPEEHEAFCFGVWSDEAHFIALSFQDAEHGRMVEIPTETSRDTSTWKQLVPESHLVLRAVAMIGGHLFVCALEDASQVYELYSRSGEKIARVRPCPMVHL